MSSSSSSSSNAHHELSDAMLQAIMNRKLALLDAEYEQCVASTRLAVDEDGNEIINQYQQINDTFPTNDNQDEIWDDFQHAQQEDDQEEKKNESDNDATADDVANAPTPSAPVEREREVLSAHKIATIKQIAANIQIKPPMWASNLSEQQWHQQILMRAGINTTNNTSKTNTNNTIGVNAQEKKKKKKKKKKASNKPELTHNSDTSQAAAAATTTSSAQFHDDFQPDFTNNNITTSTSSSSTSS